jgi:hypothetical protein
MFQLKVVQKNTTHILDSISFFFFSEIHAVYEITWKTLVGPDRPQMTIWRMRIACWITMATNTFSGYVIILLLRCNNGKMVGGGLKNRQVAGSIPDGVVGIFQ